MGCLAIGQRKKKSLTSSVGQASRAINIARLGTAPKQCGDDWAQPHENGADEFVARLKSAPLTCSSDIRNSSLTVKPASTSRT